MDTMKPRTTEEIWNQLSNDLRSYFRSRSPSAETAEDLLQETFMRIHQGLPSLQHEERLLGWVFRIARNTLADHYRQSSPTGPPPGSLEGEDSPGNLNQQFGGYLLEHLQELPSKYREAVHLAEVEGLPQAQVAHRLGLSLSGTKSRIQRGRKLLEKLLLDCCHLDFDRRGNVVDFHANRNCTGCNS